MLSNSESEGEHHLQVEPRPGTSFRGSGVCGLEAMPNISTYAGKYVINIF
jgi:hypothetical protein